MKGSSSFYVPFLDLNETGFDSRERGFSRGSYNSSSRYFSIITHPPSHKKVSHGIMEIMNITIINILPSGPPFVFDLIPSCQTTPSLMRSAAASRSRPAVGGQTRRSSTKPSNALNLSFTSGADRFSVCLPSLNQATPDP